MRRSPPGPEQDHSPGRDEGVLVPRTEPEWVDACIALNYNERDVVYLFTKEEDRRTFASLTTAEANKMSNWMARELAKKQV